MAYPLIIIGAGASSDCIDRAVYNIYERFLPPLTNNLFDGNRYSGEIIGEFPDVSGLASEAVHSVNANVSLEQYLTEVQNTKAPRNPERYKQLIALRLFLSKLFRVISSNHYKPINNYQELVTKIQDQGGKACFVNFNYDLLLEKNIRHIITSGNIDDYIKGTIKVIKIHGSCNWFYNADFREGPENHPGAYEHFMQFAKNFSEYLADIKNRDTEPVVKTPADNWEFIELEHNPEKKVYCLPALAIPVTTKENFVCPATHIQELEKCLSEVDRVLIIGWRAKDPFLLTLLKDNIKRKLPVTIVSHNSSTDVAKVLADNPNLVTNPLAKGFTEFMKSGDCDKFFNESSALM